jgi:hypothetical protein
MEATMLHDLERYRSIAADCLSEAQDACQPDHRNFHLFTAAAWLSLVRQDEAMKELIASWNTPKVSESQMTSLIFQGVFGCYRQPLPAPQTLPAFLRDRSSLKTRWDTPPAIAGVTRRAVSQRVAKFEDPK